MVMSRHKSWTPNRITQRIVLQTMTVAKTTENLIFLFGILLVICTSSFHHCLFIKLTQPYFYFICIQFQEMFICSRIHPLLHVPLPMISSHCVSRLFIHLILCSLSGQISLQFLIKLMLQYCIIRNQSFQIASQTIFYYIAFQHE